MKKNLRKLTVHRETLTRMESSGTAAGALTGVGSTGGTSELNMLRKSTEP